MSMPNQSIASGRTTTPGSGLKIDVSSSSRSVPNVESVASTVKPSATPRPMPNASRRIRSVVHVGPASEPSAQPAPNACSVCHGEANSRWLMWLSETYASQTPKSRTRRIPLRSHAGSRRPAQRQAHRAVRR